MRVGEGLGTYESQVVIGLEAELVAVLLLRSPHLCLVQVAMIFTLACPLLLYYETAFI